MKLALTALLLIACDAQVDTSYAGEPMLRLHGTAVGFSIRDVADGAAARWNTQRGSDLAAGPITALPMEPISTSELWVLVLTDPPEDAYFGFAGESPRIAEATLLLTRADEVVGAAIGLALVHVDGVVAPGSLAAQYLGGTPAPGFRMRRVRPAAELSAPQAYFAMLCGGGDACRTPRLYDLVPTTDDLATNVQFFRRSL